MHLRDDTLAYPVVLFMQLNKFKQNGPVFFVLDVCQAVAQLNIMYL